LNKEHEKLNKEHEKLSSNFSHLKEDFQHLKTASPDKKRSLKTKMSGLFKFKKN
jgi:hypothetical protein